VLTLVPWWLTRVRGGRLLAVLNGQFIAIRRSVYDAIGGFGAVRGSLGEDTALGRRLAERGHRTLFIDAATALRCRPYATFAEAWAANVRNLAVAALGSSMLAVGGAVGLVLLHLVPVLALLTGPGGAPGWPWAPLTAVALVLLPRRLADRGNGHGAGATLLHPLAVALLAVMLLESWRRARLGGSVQWRGRRYRATDAG
jgi:chlorobactene glucosyltransferase